jgi:hypothetical protein
MAAGTQQVLVFFLQNLVISRANQELQQPAVYGGVYGFVLER